METAVLGTYSTKDGRLYKVIPGEYLSARSMQICVKPPAILLSVDNGVTWTEVRKFESDPPHPRHWILSLGRERRWRRPGHVRYYGDD